jgi:1-phosphofructokinase
VADVTVFGPNPLLNVVIEGRGDGSDDIHLHAGGQGVWVARTAAELGASPTLCGFSGGEPGRLLRPLLDALPGERRLVETASPAGCLVIDRRTGEPEVVARAASDTVTRHEIDDLFSATCASALSAGALAVCNPWPVDLLPLELYANLVSDARANSVPVLVDLSSPRLDSALEGGPDVVKINDWELAGYVSGPVDGPRLRAAAELLLERGAGAAVITRGGDPALAINDSGAWELIPPRLDRGFREGCGDSMLGAMAAARAAGEDFERMLVLGAAAGAACFLRHGLGSPTRSVIEELALLVELRPL